MNEWEPLTIERIDDVPGGLVESASDSSVRSASQSGAVDSTTVSGYVHPNADGIVSVRA